MGLITDIFFAIGDFFKWMFENTLQPIGLVANWILFIVGTALLIWWCIQLFGFGNEKEKGYNGW